VGLDAETNSDAAMRTY